MTENTLKKLIVGLNRGKFTELIFLRPLTQTVDYAKVWLKKPSPKDDVVGGSCNPYKFYFIKNLEGHYRGVVLDMEQDLHWYVLPKYRGMGVLSNALKEVILPHLFQSKDEQRITIRKGYLGEKDFYASEKVALRVGFAVSKIADNSVEYILSGKEFQERDFIDGSNTEMPDERINDLRKHVQFLACSLMVVQAELEMKIGTTVYTEELKTMACEIRGRIYKIEDDCRERRRK